MAHPSRRRQRRLLVEQLRTFTASFVDSSAQADLQFDQLARSLRHVYANAESLARLVRGELAALRDAVDESRISGTDGLSSVSLSDLSCALKEASDDLAILRAIAADLRRLPVQVEGLQRVGMLIRTAAVGFAVESARTNALQSCGSLVGDLRLLGHRITEAAQEIGAHTRLTRQSLEGDWRRMATVHTELCQLRKALETTAGATAAEAQSLLDASLAALQRTGERMDRITEQAEEAVYHLQFGDILRQKSEHIRAALEETMNLLAGASSQPEFSNEIAVADQTLSIQLGQLERIRSELDDARNRLSAAFQQISARTTDLKQSLGSQLNSASHTSAGRAALDALKEDLLRLESIRQRGDELRTDARQTACNASEASNRLGGYAGELKRINSEVHLQALNSIVQTAALGDQGATLSVLSMHVDRFYRDSNDIVSTVLIILKEISRRAHGANRDEQSDRLAQSTVAARTFLDRIESAYESCRATSSEVSRLIEDHQTALGGVCTSLDFLAQHLLTIDLQIETLSDFRRQLEPWLDTQRADAAAQVDTLSRRYTMRSEREVHLGIAQSGPPPAIRTERPVIRSSSPKPADPQADPAAPMRSNSDSIRDLADPVPASSGPANPSEFGDNVELF